MVENIESDLQGLEIILNDNVVVLSMTHKNSSILFHCCVLSLVYEINILSIQHIFLEN